MLTGEELAQIRQVIREELERSVQLQDSNSQASFDKYVEEHQHNSVECYNPFEPKLD